MVRVMQVIEAVYENGVLKPLKKLKLKEHSKVIIKIIDEVSLINFSAQWLLRRLRISTTKSSRRLIMSPSNVFIDSSVLVGLNLGDEKAKELVKSLIERGCVLIINPLVFSETAYKVMFTLALKDGIKGVHDLKKHLNKYTWAYGKVKD